MNIQNAQVLDNILDQNGMSENDLLCVGKVLDKWSKKADLQDFLENNCNLLIPNVNRMAADYYGQIFANDVLSIQIGRSKRKKLYKIKGVSWKEDLFEYAKNDELIEKHLL